MTQEHLEVGYSCTSKRGGVDMGTAVIYPSPVGFIIGGVGNIGVLSETIISSDQWDQFYPSTMESYKYKENMVTFYNNGSTIKALVFNVKSGDLSTLDIAATAGYTDPASGDLYCVVAGVIVRLDTGASPMSTVWESKDFVTSPENYGAAMVKAASYPVTFKAYADGALKCALTITSGLPFSLPSGFLATKWKFRVEGTKEVYGMYVGATKMELRKV
jgi:hypothetical protein